MLCRGRRRRLSYCRYKICCARRCRIAAADDAFFRVNADSLTHIAEGGVELQRFAAGQVDADIMHALLLSKSNSQIRRCSPTPPLEGEED